ncbi:MAG: MATE family efflux transporter, partial [Roseburia sp.]|nr:MATE family efflux transporter [Roseburia sp.]MCM1242839.1 MATE family efflux transporter [Roseburia sp.]
MQKDMTQGSPMKLILGFSIPMLFGLLFQQFYSMVDTIIVGHYLGVNALAAVGATGSVNFLIIGFCMGICNGFAIPVAQEFGAGNEKNLRRYVTNGVRLAVVFAVVMTIAVVLLCRPILRLMQTPDNIIDGSYSYIVIIFLGIPVTYLYNMTSAIIRSLGDSKTPVIFLTMAAILNIGLDLLCIIVFHWGVAGAAIATVTSQAVAGICCFLFMRKKFTILQMEKDDWMKDRNFMSKLCGMGLPMGLQYSITAIGSVILQSAVNSIGSDAVATVTAGGKLSMFLMCPFDAMGSTMATYGGQNVGAGKFDRIGKGLKSCVVLGAAYSVIALGVILLFGRSLLLLFLDRGETAILENAQWYVTMNVCFYFALALVNIVRFLIQGMGYSRLAVFAGMFEMVARGLAGFVLVPYFGFTAVGFANPLAWIFADIFLIPAYIFVRKDIERIRSGQPIT